MGKQNRNESANEKLVSIELSAVKMPQLNKQPIIESGVTMSEDGKWLIHKTTITDIKSVTYFEKVLSR